MRTLTWTTLLIAITEAASGQSGKGSSAPARAATLPTDIQADSLKSVTSRPRRGPSARRLRRRNPGGSRQLDVPTPGGGRAARRAPASRRHEIEWI